jgi:hypothetical protein
VIRGPVSAGSLIFTANGGLHLPEAPALNEGSRAYDITYIDPRNKKQRLCVIRPNATVGSPAFFIIAPPADGSVPPNVKFTQCVDTATSKFVIVVQALRDLQAGEELLVDYGAEYGPLDHERFTSALHGHLRHLHRRGVEETPGPRCLAGFLCVLRGHRIVTPCLPLDILVLD